ncbi:uncharacterized protein L3040_005849 [Drepanopeziza brunnea f. sp. 'multigermtubi']|uniref:GPI anchored peptidase m48 n=1 Tax=Marssonina brunnea f. sp. multigermtubi (strain MB_m1) TaxID=1072389 RepID=K1Y6T5_MARBU|nr:GPI anchored peptidase m48 [Drepanopeziza brunnea f. sp. 'multigermtubi' MB_m1]EKD20914.1 GPI anchored peptidase m48 [Drepanopeziza brunnea f. sp. 'multigermtubi' MB_m1]KAJ5041303.1 hypothetical protein L3040_005849 [Drepanopeziza brunnea f. sp. 'multigermtubi']
MLSRSLPENSLRALSRKPFKVLPRAFATPLPHSLTFIRQRYESGFRRFPPPSPRRKPPHKIHYRYDEEEARKSEPPFTPEQLRRAFRSPATRWMAIMAVGGGTIFYFSNLETVPATGRRRFNCSIDAMAEVAGALSYKVIMLLNSHAILPAWDKRTELVNKVMTKLITASGLKHEDWEVHVIESDKANAFIVPGGKVFVYSGLLPVAKTEDGLATVLSHEMAHDLARHGKERLSSAILIQDPLRFAISFLDYWDLNMGLGLMLADLMLDLGVMQPASRKQESEADYIGLMLMAHSCYDPKEAIKFWKRLEAFSKDRLPEWLSTHPSHSSRIAQITAWLPKAEEVRRKSDCASTVGHSEDFKNAFKGSNWVAIFKD